MLRCTILTCTPAHCRATTHYMTHMLPAHLVMSQLLQGQYRRAHEVKLSTDALYESELAATHQAWELVVELKQNKLVSKQQGKQQPDQAYIICMMQRPGRCVFGSQQAWSAHTPQPPGVTCLCRLLTTQSCRLQLAASTASEHPHKDTTRALLAAAGRVC